MWNVFYAIVLVAIFLVCVAILLFVATDKEKHDTIRRYLRIFVVAVIIISVLCAIGITFMKRDERMAAERKKMVEGVVFGDGFKISMKDN